MSVQGVSPGVSATTSVSNPPNNSALDRSASVSNTTAPVTTAQPDSHSDQEPAYTLEHVQTVLKRANELLHDLQSSVQLEVKSVNNQDYVNLVDTKAGLAIRTFPASAFVQMVHRGFIGLLMDARV